MLNCPGDFHLRRYLAGGLPAEDRSTVDEHLANCETCRSFLERVTSFAETVDSSTAGGSERPAPDPSLPHIPGFVIQSLIAQGGNGVVYRAVNTTTKRTVALKLLRSGVTATAAERTRFRINGEALARLSHPNIVTLYSVGEYQGHPYVEMEYVEGGSLDRLIRHSFPTEHEAATLLKQLAQAIQYAHELGVIHRDLKPANVLLHRTDLTSNALAYSSFTPKIADFGSAKVISSDGMLTPTFSILGTPSYMAPEVASGEAQAATVAADIYGLGAIGYDLLTGRPPFFGATPYDTIRMVIQDEPTLPIRLRANLSRDVETVLLKCLEKDPKRRYPSAKALAEEWDRILLGKPVIARPVGTITRVGRAARRAPVASGLLALLLLVVVSSVIGLTILWRQAVAAQDLAQKNEERAARRLQMAQRALEAFKASAQKRAAEKHRQAQEDRDGLRKLADLYEAIYDDNPDDVTIRHDASYALLQIANLLAELGDTHDACAMTQRGLDQMRKVVAACPDQARFRSSLSEACMQTVGHRSTIGLTEGNRQLVQEAFDLASALAREFPQEDHYRGTRAMFALTLGSDYLRDGRTDEARQFFRDAVRTHKDLLVKHGRVDPHRHEFYAIALERLAYCEYHCGATPDTYLAIVNEKIERMESYFKSNPDEAAAHFWHLASEYTLAADVLRNIGRIDEAAEREAQADRFSRDCLEKYPESHNYRAIRAGFLMRTGFRIASIDRYAALALMSQAAKLSRYDGAPSQSRLQTSLCLNTLPELRKPDEVRQRLETSLSSENAYPFDRLDYALALYQSGLYRDAEVEFAKCEANPTVDLAGNHLRSLLRIMNRHYLGEVEAARQAFRERSAAMQADYRTSCDAWYFHDEAWRLIEGSEPPARLQPTSR